jgi:hypothetical protein
VVESKNEDKKRMKINKKKNEDKQKKTQQERKT